VIKIINKNIESIIEGCYRDTPSKLLYCEIDTPIPKDEKILYYEHKIHPEGYLFYAKGVGFPDIEKIQIINNPFFSNREEVKENIKNNKAFEGNFLLNNIKNFNWIFEARRSLVTSDGRIYVDMNYFQNNWRWYLNSAPTILKECGEIFKGKIDKIYDENLSSSVAVRTNIPVIEIPLSHGLNENNEIYNFEEFKK